MIAALLLTVSLLDGYSCRMETRISVPAGDTLRQVRLQHGMGLTQHLEYVINVGKDAEEIITLHSGYGNTKNTFSAFLEDRHGKVLEVAVDTVECK